LSVGDPMRYQPLRRLRSERLLPPTVAPADFPAQASFHNCRAQSSAPPRYRTLSSPETPHQLERLVVAVQRFKYPSCPAVSWSPPASASCGGISIATSQHPRQIHVADGVLGTLLHLPKTDCFSALEAALALLSPRLRNTTYAVYVHCTSHVLRQDGTYRGRQQRRKSIMTLSINFEQPPCATACASWNELT
jgi:hypothetical protein